jgi:superfamily II DNA or RNA helicase
MTPGSIVKCRNRDWVLLPSEPDAYLLKPLTGSPDEIVKIKKQLSDLIGSDIPSERVEPSIFPFPTADEVIDFASAHILWNAARLTLRESSAPFRSLGRISIRPRVYQFVPLLMALRLDPVRLFIADDVGVGKTIEALLVARELYDRGEIKRFAVLCPPYLCEQWEKELREKFNFEPVIVRSGTIGALERRLPSGTNIYKYFHVQVISIDWIKSERNKHLFIHFCPELVIVDEVHGAAEATGGRTSQQERHELLKEIAKKDIHLILLTATPHSGKEEAFRSLLSLLKPEFGNWTFSELNENQRVELAKHFVQRTRKDIEDSWESQSCFPERIAEDISYRLSDDYQNLFKKTYDFCFEIIKSGEKLEERKRRVRNWGALALLRCVMSSPASALKALELRYKKTENTEEDDEEYFSSFIFEKSDDRAEDENPTPPIEATETNLPEPEKRKLRELARLAENLMDINKDTKLLKCLSIVQNLLNEGFNPIIWCRYVSTAEYVGEKLREKNLNIQVVTITGRMPDDERKIKIDEIDSEKPRVLIATDCLSEGINLQDKFNAIIHYDLPWNPNRLEQREGRVDRYGQNAKKVKAIRFYGEDNPVDGAVIKVLLEKAKQIYKTLGTYVPVPEESESVLQAVLNALFLSDRTTQQISLFENQLINEFHSKWDKDVEREKVNRTRFAQRALKPAEVMAELEKTDAVLGDPESVRKFLFDSAQRIGFQIIRDRRENVFKIPIDANSTRILPDAIRYALPKIRGKDYWFISFDSPTPEGAEYIGRNHPFVSVLAQYIMEDALKKSSVEHSNKIVSRCGVICTKDVKANTNLLLLRVRYLFQTPDKPPLLSEEIMITGYSLNNNEIYWIEKEEALQLLTSAQPHANIPLDEKKEIFKKTIQNFGDWKKDKIFEDKENPVNSGIYEILMNRAKELEDSHKKIRKAVFMRIKDFSIKPQFPPDLIGLLILKPLE